MNALSNRLVDTIGENFDPFDEYLTSDGRRINIQAYVDLDNHNVVTINVRKNGTGGFYRMVPVEMTGFDIPLLQDYILCHSQQALLDLLVKMAETKRGGAL